MNMELALIVSEATSRLGWVVFSRFQGEPDSQAFRAVGESAKVALDRLPAQVAGYMQRLLEQQTLWVAASVPVS